MARIFITGSSDGLGKLAAQWLVARNHQVVLHARNEKRAQDAMHAVPAAEKVLTGDLSSIEETKQLAKAVNSLGQFDAVIHNAGVYQASRADMLHINTLAPYILTCLIQRPERLIYLSSSLHKQGRSLTEVTSVKGVSYSDSKLHMVQLPKAIARMWPDVFANAVDPGWVPTKMGGANAPDDLDEGYQTQVWLATSTDDRAMVSGRYFHHRKESRYHPESDDPALQANLLATCELLTGIPFPGGSTFSETG